MQIVAYEVDLRGYSGEEFEIRRGLLEAHTWTMDEYANIPGLFSVTFDLDFTNVPLPTLLKVPANRITQVGE